MQHCQAPLASGQFDYDVFDSWAESPENNLAYDVLQSSKTELKIGRIVEELAQAVSFGVLLKRYRRAAHFTQELLAERAGYSAIYLSKLERGERRPLAFTVATLADALGLDAEARAALEHAAQRIPSAPRERPPARIPTGSDSLIPLVGRTEEQALLARYLEGEEPPLLLVLGEPGIGKTRLLQEASHQAQARGWCVLEGRCHRHSGQELYAPLLGALERALARLPQAEQREALQQCEWLLRLLPERAEEAGLSLPPWEVSPAQERRLLFAAVRRFLDQIAGPSGTLLVLDDLQWVSADTLDVLSSLFRADVRRPLRLIGAYRHTEILATDALSLAWPTSPARSALSASSLALCRPKRPNACWVSC